MSESTPEVIFYNGQFTTLNKSQPVASAVGVKDGKFVAVGSDAEVLALVGSGTRKIDLQKRSVLPGLCDNHTHVIRGGLNYNLELRWDGVRSLADALDMLKRLMEGGASKVSESGAFLMGGHSVEDQEPKYGLCVFGEVERDVRPGLAAPDDEIARLGMASVAKAAGHDREAERIVREQICDRTDDAGPPPELAERTEQILTVNQWLTPGKVAS